jgi:hypothetical protein
MLREAPKLRRGLLSLSLLQLVSSGVGWGCSDVVDGILFVAASVVAIGDYAFDSCSSLKSVTFEADSALQR